MSYDSTLPIELSPSLDQEKIDVLDLLTIVMCAPRIHDDSPDRGWELTLATLARQMKWSRTKTMAVQARLHALCDAIVAGHIPDMTLDALKQDLKRSMPLLKAAVTGKLHGQGTQYSLNAKALLVRAGMTGFHTRSQPGCLSTIH